MNFRHLFTGLLEGPMRNASTKMFCSERRLGEEKNKRNRQIAYIVLAARNTASAMLFAPKGFKLLQNPVFFKNGKYLFLSRGAKKTR